MFTGAHFFVDTVYTDDTVNSACIDCYYGRAVKKCPHIGLSLPLPNALELC